MGDYQAQSLWQMRLGFALRTTLACTIVDCTVLYGPPQLKRYITYPSFSYMTTILIAPTLGDVMRSCWHVIFATAQVLLPSVLTLWLVELLLENQPIARNPGNTRKPNQEPSDSQNQQRWNFKSVWRNIIPSTRSIIFALKCSLALGLAVLFGLLYNKENGYWSGLTIAISFVTGRQATFTVTNARVQGTAVGSIYGIIWLFIFQRLEKFKLMYGQAGGISAAIATLLILGRENYGPPSEFAFAGMIEASIGLLCFLLVEIVFYRMRAATLAKNKLSQSMEALRDCIGVNLCVPASTGLRDDRDFTTHLKSHIKELETFIQEAETELNCWFLPFQGAGYNRVLGSLSKIADLLLFVAYKMEFIAQVEQNLGGVWEELRQQMNADLELLKGCLEEASSIKSLPVSETLSESDYHDKVETIVSSFLQHLQEVADKVHTSDSEEKHKSQMVLCLTSLGFCIPSVMRETMEMKKEVRKLVKLNSPT
ncbi:unnamed protein product [Malus baccata var. baccata]